MLLLLIERGHLVYVVHLSVNTDADVAVLAYLLQELCVLALLCPHGRGNYLYASIKGHHPVNYLIYALPLYHPAALGAVRYAYAGIQQAHVVVNLGDSSNSGTRVIGGALLVYAYGRGQALDVVHIRLFHLAQEQPGIR